MDVQFLSDNTSGVDNRIMEYMLKANEGCVQSYGYDEYTMKAEALIKEEFGEGARFFPVLTGTGANVISLASIMSPFQSVICVETAHINVDECGAPERFLGSKLVSLPHKNGKIDINDIKPKLDVIGFEHDAQPAVISISQVTECGVAYTLDELKAISEFAKENNLLLHVDGSRLANAAAHLGCSLSEAAYGADIISLGGTKNGMMMGEAIVVINPEVSLNMKYIRKQAMQLYSKMRFLSAQFIPYLSDKIWLENAKNANKMASMLAGGLEKAGFEVEYPVEANAVFVTMPKKVTDSLLEKYMFYIWDEQKNSARLMCSFTTTENDVKSFLQEVLSNL